jgi:hypothetical protein
MVKSLTNISLAETNAVLAAMRVSLQTRHGRALVRGSAREPVRDWRRGREAIAAQRDRPFCVLA